MTFREISIIQILVECIEELGVRSSPRQNPSRFQSMLLGPAPFLVGRQARLFMGFNGKHIHTFLHLTIVTIALAGPGTREQQIDISTKQLCLSASLHFLK